MNKSEVDETQQIILSDAGQIVDNELFDFSNKANNKDLVIVSDESEIGEDNEEHFDEREIDIKEQQLFDIDNKEQCIISDETKNNKVDNFDTSKIDDIEDICVSDTNEIVENDEGHLNKSEVDETQQIILSDAGQIVDNELFDFSNKANNKDLVIVSDESEIGEDNEEHFDEREIVIKEQQLFDIDNKEQCIISDKNETKNNKVDNFDTSKIDDIEDICVSDTNEIVENDEGHLNKSEVDETEQIILSDAGKIVDNELFDFSNKINNKDLVVISDESEIGEDNEEHFDEREIDIKEQQLFDIDNKEQCIISDKNETKNNKVDNFDTSKIDDIEDIYVSDTNEIVENDEGHLNKSEVDETQQIILSDAGQIVDNELFDFSNKANNKDLVIVSDESEIGEDNEEHFDEREIDIKEQQLFDIDNKEQCIISDKNETKNNKIDNFDTSKIDDIEDICVSDTNEIVENDEGHLNKSEVDETEQIILSDAGQIVDNELFDFSNKANNKDLVIVSDESEIGEDNEEHFDEREIDIKEQQLFDIDNKEQCIISDETKNNKVDNFDTSKIDDIEDICVSDTNEIVENDEGHLNKSEVDETEQIILSDAGKIVDNELFDFSNKINNKDLVIVSDESEIGEDNEEHFDEREIDIKEHVIISDVNDNDSINSDDSEIEVITENITMFPIINKIIRINDDSMETREIVNNQETGMIALDRSYGVRNIELAGNNQDEILSGTNGDSNTTSRFKDSISCYPDQGIIYTFFYLRFKIFKDKT